MSQLSGLRSSLRRLQSLRDQNRLTSWITAIESVSNRKEKWDKTEQGLRKIHQLVTDLQKIWQELDISSPELVITVGARNELQQILWAEAVRTLVDAIIRAHKRDLEKVQNPSSQEETV
jgi:CRISPR-associated protein Csx10